MTKAVLALDTPSLGDRSYLVTDGHTAIAIDPQRDISRVLEAAERRNIAITHVIETHVHNDYVSGGLALARSAGASYLLPAGEQGSFSHLHATEGQDIRSGGIRVQALHTPGHTPTHMSYLASVDDVLVGVFSGGSMLYGAVGRTDLIAPSQTHDLTLRQHRSVRRLAETIEGPVPVWPTHGFGSHCSSGTSEIHRSGTVAEEQTRNPALLEDDPEVFATALLAGLGPYPRYYERMGPANLAGPRALEPGPGPLLSPVEVVKHLDDGSMVVDLRQRAQYAQSHLPGTVNVELRDDLPTYLGWVHGGSSPVVLLAPDPEMLSEARVMLGRIGYDDLVGAVIEPDGGIVGGPPLVSRRRVGWRETNEERPADAVLVDVRDAHEWASGHHSAAVHVPFHRVLDHDVLNQQGRIPPDREVWVYCATGNRAAVATSLLAGVGHDTVLVDDFCLPGDVPG